MARKKPEDTIFYQLEHWDRLSPLEGLMVEEDFIRHGMTTPCWKWTRGKRGAGYGKFWHPERSSRIYVGRYLLGILDNSELDQCHLCPGNPSCTRPDHLYAGTTKENAADKLRDGTDNRGSKNGRAKLNEGQVRGIKILLSLGQDVESLANAYEVSVGAINSIKYGNAWTHVTIPDLN